MMTNCFQICENQHCENWLNVLLKKWKPQPAVIYFVNTKYDEYQKMQYPPNINPPRQILIQGSYCLRLYQCGQFFHTEINTSLHYQVPNWCTPNISSSTPMQLEHTNFGWFFFFSPKWLGSFNYIVFGTTQRINIKKFTKKMLIIINFTVKVIVIVVRVFDLHNEIEGSSSSSCHWPKLTSFCWN